MLTVKELKNGDYYWVKVSGEIALSRFYVEPLGCKYYGRFVIMMHKGRSECFWSDDKNVKILKRLDEQPPAPPFVPGWYWLIPIGLASQQNSRVVFIEKEMKDYYDVPHDAGVYYKHFWRLGPKVEPPVIS